MELGEYWLIVRKWWWVLLLGLVLGGAAAFVVSSQMQPMYEASTLLMVGGSLDVVSPTTGELQTSEKLAQTYAELVKARPVLDATMGTLSLDEDPEVAVSLVRNTQLLRVTVSGPLPTQTAMTANELARQLILQSPSGPQREEQAYREFVRGQLVELEREIATLSTALMEAPESTDATEIARMQQELNARRANYSSLLEYMQQSATNYIRVIEEAQVPESPTRPRIPQNVALAAIVGLMLAGGAAFLIEYLDDSVRGQADIEGILELPALGTITQITSNGSTPEKVTIAHPHSAYAEAYRILRTTLRYSLSADASDRVFLVTSVGPGEGKTTTASNLAVVMAGAGQKVLLIDGDLRRPDIHTVFGVSNELGLSSYLVGEAGVIEEVLQPTDIAGLTVISSGPRPPNPAELLGSPRMTRLLEEASARADVVILDSPPLLAVADSSVLASLVTGTILVVHAGHTQLGACKQAAETIGRTGGNLLGVVLNRLDVKRSGYYGGYYQYQYYGNNGNEHMTETPVVPKRLRASSGLRSAGLWWGAVKIRVGPAKRRGSSDGGEQNVSTHRSHA